MIDALKNIELVDKVGGRFRLSALIQKRVSELIQGARPLIDSTKGMTMIEIAVEEIVQDKIVAIEKDEEETKEANPLL